MPCYDDRDSCVRTVSREAVVFNSNEEYENKVLYSSVATPLLCEAMDIIKKNGLIHKCSKNLVEWVAKHEKDDLDRIKKLYDAVKAKQKELDELYAGMDERDVEIMAKLVDLESETTDKADDYVFGWRDIK
jgi:hypothetical protein